MQDATLRRMDAQRQTATQRQIDDDYALAMSLDDRNSDVIFSQLDQQPSQLSTARQRDRDQFVGLLDELPNDAILDTVLPTPRAPSIFDPTLRKEGVCPICSENGPLVQSCANHSVCTQCMIPWIKAQLPGKFIKCYHDGCEAEISSDKVFDIMPTSYNSSIEDFYNRRGIKLIAAPGKCPRCRIHVEKGDGCNHITCPCGTQFCYACGDYWKCSCESSRTPQLVQRAHQLQDQQWRRVTEARLLDQDTDLISRMWRLNRLTDRRVVSIFTTLSAQYQVSWTIAIIMVLFSKMSIETAIIIILWYMADALIMVWSSTMNYTTVESAIIMTIGLTNVLVTVATHPIIDWSWFWLVAMQVPFVIVLTVDEKRAIIPVCMIVSSVAFYSGYVWSAYFGMCAYTVLSVAERILT